jgi:hypothetical protein
VLAFAVGEESFDDTNNDGLYGSGEPFTDLAEAFVDYDEDGMRDSANPVEPFRDFDGSLGFDSGDSQFNGLLCATGNPSNIQCPAPRTLHVRNSITIVMSGSSPVINTDSVASGGDVTVSCGSCYNQSTGVINIGSEEIFSLSAVIRDVNNQPMPATSTVAFTSDGSAGAVQGTSTFSVPCTSNDTRVANTYGIAFKGAKLTAENPSGASSLELKVTSPSGVETFYRFTVIATLPP